RLQMLKVKRVMNYDARTGQRPFRGLPVEWVDIDDPDPAGGGQKAVYDQGFAQGGAIFRRLEGCWFGFGAVYFNATDGGDAGHGQIWEYRPGGRSGGSLKLIYETPDPEILTFPDNINVTPRGGLVLCEDTGFVRSEENFLDDGTGQAPFAEQKVIGLTRDGRIFDFAVNLLDNREWAGACWSPDGQYLFVNTQGDTTEPGTIPGRTYAIWGPWQRGAL
ncbi:MAG TPA: alkaline phosphatase PhoX, partial [Actinomycetes bacterium]|nr:alkaline phosphatase PhoX [Actinomycetes bacterium]